MASQPVERTLICTVVFADLVGHTRRPVADQKVLKHRFSAAVAEAIAGVPEGERVIVDSGDGAAIVFTVDPEDALVAALHLRRVFGQALRVGLNLGPLQLIRDVNGQPGVVGDARARRKGRLPSCGDRRLPVRHGDDRHDAARLVRLEGEARAPAVERGQPRADVGEPDPAPDESWNPAPVSATRTCSTPSSQRASMSILPPSGSGARPCLIAFSTSVISIIGGNGSRASVYGTPTEKASRSPMRTCNTSR